MDIRKYIDILAVNEGKIQKYPKDSKSKDVENPILEEQTTDDMDDEDEEDERNDDSYLKIKHGDYVRDEQDGPRGEIFKMKGDVTDRKVRIEDKDDRGWYIHPSRLVKVDNNDPMIQRWFPDDDFIDDDEYLNEAEKLKGVSQKPFTKDQLIAYLDSILTGTKHEKFPKSKLQYPYIHRENVPTVDVTEEKLKDLKGVVDSDTGYKFDLGKLYDLITQRPKAILKQNEKMRHSDGTTKIFYNIGLPAIKGLAADEQVGRPLPGDSKKAASSFVIINTCPGAGSCMVVCFATKGGYVQWKASSLSQTRLLNYLYNDPNGFMSNLSSEISSLTSGKRRKKESEVVIRWHDSGDFFSNEYLEMAYAVARQFPNILFYAYTKIADIALGPKPDNFVINFSMGAQKTQEKRIDFKKQKNSIIVPKTVFKDLLIKVPVSPDSKKKVWKYVDDNAIKTLKNNLAKEYDVDINSIVTYEELMNIPWSNRINKYNVIVKPGDGDVGAARKDVLTSFLLIH
jgi:hypothetical protein